MDKFDLQILRLMQEDSRRTADSISEHVGLSAPAVQKRLKKLRTSGVIQKEIAVLDSKKLNRRLTVITEVILEREDRPTLDSFKRQMQENPLVQQCYYMTGDADFLLILQVTDMEEYESFTNKFLFEEASVTRFKTSVVMDKVKVSLDVLGNV